MSAVHINHLSFRHSAAVEVDAETHLGPGWTGVVGANGSGKTTLLNLIAGRLIPTAGSVVLDPVDAVVVLCEQTADEVTPDIEVFANSWVATDASLRGRLDLDPEGLARWPTLSPGERKRWQIAAALSREPDVLLLDEPTNHLDADGRRLLVAALGRFGGVGMVVSHDRGLLEELTARTMRIHRGDVSVWNGAYGAASRAWQEVEAGERAERDRLRTEARKAERRLIEQRQVNDQKRAAFKRRNNTASFKDIDSRSAARGWKHAEGEKAAGKVLATAAKASQRASEAAAATEADKTLGGEIFIGFEPAPRRLVTSHDGPLTAGETTIVGHVAIGVERTDRVWLRGRNGAGKTTLLRALVADADLPSEKVLLLEQALTPEQVDRVVEQMRGLDRKQRGKVLGMVATLGVDPAVLLASQRPSPGEARKLAMALGLGRAAWLVVLDEPTNHLDLPSIERLERALASYPGALIVVTHDEEFADRLDLVAFDLP